MIPCQSLPTELRAGDSLTWSAQTLLPLGSSVFYVLNAVVAGTPTRMRVGGSNGVAVDVSGLATFSLFSAETGAWVPGRYQWNAFALDANGNRSELAQGTINISPDPAGTTPLDTRTFNQKVLDNIRALLLGKSLDDVAMYKLGGRELTKIPVNELQMWEAQFERRVRSERIRRGERVPSKTLGIAFGGR